MRAERRIQEARETLPGRARKKAIANTEERKNGDRVQARDMESGQCEGDHDQAPRHPGKNSERGIDRESTMKRLELTIEDRNIFYRNVDPYNFNKRAATADAWMTSDFKDSIHMLAKNRDFFKAWAKERK